MDGQSTSGKPEGHPPSQGELSGLHGAIELLNARQYDRVEQLLLERQEAAQRTGQVAKVVILATACQLCVTCRELRAEMELHRNALEQADRREHRLQAQLQAIINLLNGEPEIKLSGIGETTPADEGGQEPPPGTKAGIWKRLQRLLDAKAARSTAEPARESIHPPAQGQPRIAYGQRTLDEIPGGAYAASSPEPEGPQLAVYCLGRFQVYLNERPIESWPSGKGKAIFKYLINHRQHPVGKEVLMELFWPNLDPDAARNNLNVSIFGLRQALRGVHGGFTHVLYEEECYLFDPRLSIWVDMEEFRQRLLSAQALERQGEPALAMREYGAAEALYQGEFLAEDRYEEWPITVRRELQEAYLDMLERLSHYYLDQADYTACAGKCSLMLAVDPCHEGAHRRLMRCYYRQGQPHLALRQYHYCEEALWRELNASPTRATTALYERIRLGESLSAN